MAVEAFWGSAETGLVRLRLHAVFISGPRLRRVEAKPPWIRGGGALNGLCGRGRLEVVFLLLRREQNQNRAPASQKA